MVAQFFSRSWYDTHERPLLLTERSACPSLNERDTIGYTSRSTSQYSSYYAVNFCLDLRQSRHVERQACRLQPGEMDQGKREVLSTTRLQQDAASITLFRFTNGVECGRP